jgi:ABC-2 type transport system permease protein
MTDLLYAEWIKTAGNRRLAAFLVWIYPIGMAAFMAIMVIAQIASSGPSHEVILLSAGRWTEDVLWTWDLITGFPMNVFGRMLLLASMAAAFAGEYQWGTWKNIIPRNRRPLLILSKLATVVSITMLALLATSIVVGVGQALAHRAAGVDYGPQMSWKAIGLFATDYAREAFLAALSLAILAAFSGVATLVTRSLLGGLLCGFGFSILEPQELWFVLGTLFDRPGIVNLYRFMPTYNLNNLRSWWVNQSSWVPSTPGFTAQPTLLFSSVVLGLWLVGLVALALFVFEKQDITS